MKTIKKVNLLKLGVIMLLVGTFCACSDSGTGVNGEDPGKEPTAPTVPQLDQTFTIDISYFQSSGASAKTVAAAAMSNYEQASRIATNKAALFQMGNPFIGWFMLADNNKPLYKNGTWVWEYDFSSQGGTVSVKLISEANNDGSYSWALFVSIQTKNLSLNNYKLYEGTVSADGSTGEWTMFLPKPELKNAPEFSYSWTIKSETNKTISVDVTNLKGFGGVAFARDGSVYEMTISGKASSDVYWNTSTGTGFFINSDGEKKCWDSSYQNATCS